MYASSVHFFNLDKGLSNPLNPLSADTTEPKSISFKRPRRSPKLTLELTTPSLASFWYNSVSALVPIPATCKFFHAAFALRPVIPIPGANPFATANAPALIKFLAWVIGDKIVLAICDVAFGSKTKFLYKLLSAQVVWALPEAASIASATSFNASLPLAGLVTSAVLLKSISLYILASKLSPCLAATSPTSSILLKNNGRPPLAKVVAEVLTKSPSKTFLLAYAEISPVCAKIVCTGSLVLPKASSITFLWLGFK